MGLEPASVRAFVHTFRHEYLGDQQAYCNQILSGASFGWEIVCIRFWVRLDQNSGRNRIAPIGLYWGKSCDHSSFFIFDWFFIILAGKEDCL